jgi:hypothetical protein
MTPPIVQVEGTLQPDGTLMLDSKPDLPPGRARVTVQPLVDYTQTDIWRFFERIRAEQQACGFVPRSRAEIDADIAAARQEDEERLREIERIHEECEQHRQQRPASGQE